MLSQHPVSIAHSLIDMRLKHVDDNVQGGPCVAFWSMPAKQYELISEKGRRSLFT